jgi:hypothetical protein
VRPGNTRSAVGADADEGDDGGAPAFDIGFQALAAGAKFVVGDFSGLSLLLLRVCVGGSAFLAYHMFQTYQSVELDGDVIRGRRFWTRQYVERELDQSSEVVALEAVVKTIHTKIADKLLGSIRGYEIRFEDGGRRITLVRQDMANVDALIETLVDRTQRTA